MIHVIATIEVVAGKRQAFLDEFHKLAPKVREEAGCIEYGPTLDAKTDIERQIPMRDNVVVIIEKWESLDALKTHLVAPHLLEYRQNVKDLVTKTELQLLQPA